MGFITSLDRYVSRKEGWVIAKENNQIQFGLESNLESLASENLYKIKKIRELLVKLSN